MIYGYIRTSTDKQNNDNQRFEIINFISSHGLHIDKWVEETISSRKGLPKRKLGKLLATLKQDDILITSEISRLGRNLMQIMGILNHCMNVGCQVWTIKDNYRLGDDIQSKILAFAFGLAAEIEHNLISQRTKACLTRLKSENKPIGRPKGSKNKRTKLSGKLGIINKMLSTNHSKAQIARHLKIHYTTLYKYLKQQIVSA